MPYAYYAKLKARDKAIYRRSDEIEKIDLPGAFSLHPLVGQLEKALGAEDRKGQNAFSRTWPTPCFAIWGWLR